MPSKKPKGRGKGNNPKSPARWLAEQILSGKIKSTGFERIIAMHATNPKKFSRKEALYRLTMIIQIERDMTLNSAIPARLIPRHMRPNSFTLTPPQNETLRKKFEAMIQKLGGRPNALPSPQPLQSRFLRSRR